MASFKGVMVWSRTHNLLCKYCENYDYTLVTIPLPFSSHPDPSWHYSHRLNPLYNRFYLFLMVMDVDERWWTVVNDNGRREMPGRNGNETKVYFSSSFFGKFKFISMVSSLKALKKLLRTILIWFLNIFLLSGWLQTKIVPRSSLFI